MNEDFSMLRREMEDRISDISGYLMGALDLLADGDKMGCQSQMAIADGAIEHFKTVIAQINFIEAIKS